MATAQTALNLKLSPSTAVLVTRNSENKSLKARLSTNAASKPASIKNIATQVPFACIKTTLD
jgi:hypothetical protein